MQETPGGENTQAHPFLSLHLSADCELANITNLASSPSLDIVISACRHEYLAVCQSISHVRHDGKSLFVR